MISYIDKILPAGSDNDGVLFDVTQTRWCVGVWIALMIVVALMFACQPREPKIRPRKRCPHCDGERWMTKAYGNIQRCPQCHGCGTIPG